MIHSVGTVLLHPQRARLLAGLVDPTTKPRTGAPLGHLSQNTPRQNAWLPHAPPLLLLPHNLHTQRSTTLLAHDEIDANSEASIVAAELGMRDVTEVVITELSTPPA